MRHKKLAIYRKLNKRQKLNYLYRLGRGLFCVSLFLGNTLPALAADVANSQEQTTVTENTVTQTTVYGTSKEWGLTETEWARYQQLMQGPSGLWYRQLSPAAVLGLQASNPEDEKHFAEVYAEQEHQKVAHELAFNQAAFQAMRRLYPDEKMIKPFDTTPFNPGGRHNTQ